MYITYEMGEKHPLYTGALYIAFNSHSSSVINSHFTDVEIQTKTSQGTCPRLCCTLIRSIG